MQNAEILKLKNLNESELELRTRSLVQRERELTAEILHYLSEINRRRLYAKRGFSSLHEYVVKELGYSDGAAHRRISAMRLIQEVPQVEETLKKGTLNLTTVSQLQGFFQRDERLNKKAYEPKQKEALIKAIENKSSRECEKILTQISPQAMPKESLRRTSAEESSLRVIADEALLKKFQRIRELARGKSNIQSSYQELLHYICDVAIEKLEPKALASAKKSSEKKAPVPAQKLTRSRTIPAEIKRQVWFRDRGQCTFKDSKTGRQCQSKRFLQYEHCKPWSLGGENSLENVKLLCREHNALMSIKTFGTQKMGSYLKT